MSNEKTKQAEDILKKFGLKLAPKWKGVIPCWHRWHQNDTILCWLTTYEEYLDRIIEIDKIKPKREHAVRFTAFKPVKGKFPKMKADADRQKADADWQKADADWYKADADIILKYHKEECSKIPFDYKTNSLIFN